MPVAPSSTVRSAIRDVLTTSAEFQSLPPDTRREIAQGLVRISSTAVALAGEETPTPARGTAGAALPPPPLAEAQSAGAAFSGVAAERVAGTTRQVLDAVSFPRFVTELITGVFRAMVDSNQQQMQSYVELIRNVSATTDGFADANVGGGGARRWLAERFPGSFVVEGDEEEPEDPSWPLSPEERAEREASVELRLRPGASPPTEGALRTTLGIAPGDSVPPGSNPEGLVPFARAALARNRQQMLATMVMMGMQRIVIDSGRLSANMRFHIDTRSAAADDRGSSLDVRNDIEASGNAMFGPWGMEARMKNTIGYVSTERTQTTEEMNTELDLDSSVELVFRTDYVPLERMAGTGDVERIRVNTLNPDEEARRARDERTARREAQRAGETTRASELNQRLATPRQSDPIPEPPTPAPTAGRETPAAPAAEIAPAETPPADSAPAETAAPADGAPGDAADAETPPA